MKEKTINLFRVVILSVILSTAIGYSFADWTPPAGAPPFGNTPPPINIGSATQERVGNLILDNWLVAGKAETQSTVATDGPNTLATKDYVVARATGTNTMIKGYPCYAGGAVGDSNNNVINCDTPPAGAPTIMHKLVITAVGSTPDKKIASWNNWVTKAGTIYPELVTSGWTSNCKFAPANSYGTYTLYGDLGGGVKSGTALWDWCTSWLGTASVKSYYIDNGDPTYNFFGNISRGGGCFNTKACNGSNTPGVGGGWVLTTMY